MKQTDYTVEVLEHRIAPAAAYAEFFIGDIDGENGFGISTGALGKAGVSSDYDIKSVANAGDVNGDGINDLLVGSPNTGGNKGHVTLIFGRPDGFPVDITMNGIGTNGVILIGEAVNDHFGASVAAAGDVNGDGIDDFIVGAPDNAGGGPSDSYRGAAYVIFGKQSWGSSLNVSTLNGTTGFKVSGADSARTGNDGIGQVVGGFSLVGTGEGGDFNGDGYADVVIGAPDIGAFIPDNGGGAYIVFGKNTNAGANPFPANINVATLDGGNGLLLASPIGNEFMGNQVGFVGDVNGDGLTDIAIGNQGRNGNLVDWHSYIVFGAATGNTAVINLTTLGARGFEIPHDPDIADYTYFGNEMTMRDIDGDSDLDFGISFQKDAANPVQGYVFAKNKGTGFTSNPFVSTADDQKQVLIGMDNFTVNDAYFDLGDFNGDGNYDILSFVHGLQSPFVSFGKKPTASYTINNNSNATGINFTGFQVPVNGGALDPIPFFIGDISGDGIDDVLVLPPPNTVAEKAFIIFGNSINPTSNGKTVTFHDVDGDTVTVKTSVGAFTQDMFKLSHPAGAVPGGQQLDLLDLTLGGQDFSHANITFSVKKGATGDGKVNVGAINATLIDLGTVSIPGGLGSIDAGDADFEKPGLNKLDVDRFGRTLGGPAVPNSDIVGRIGTIIVDTDFDQATLNVTGAATEGLGTMTVKGSYSGDIILSGPLGTVKTGDMLTGASLDANGTSTKNTTITAAKIEAGVTIDLATTLGKLTATEIGLSAISAQHIDNITVKGDAKLALAGNLSATIVGVDGIGTISAKGAFFGVVNTVGLLGTFKSGDILPGAIITAGGAAPKKTSITAHVIGDNVTISVAGVISKLSAAKIGDANIAADRIDALSVTGDTKLAIAGDLTADIGLDNAGEAGKVKAIGSAKIAGLFHDAKITAAGSIGSFSAGAMQNASLFAGYTPTTVGQPLNGGTFLADALLGSFTITGKAAITGGTAGMDDSFVIATALGATSISSIDSTTGALGWGFAYQTSIKNLKIKDPAFTYDAHAGGLQTVDDFSVRKLV